MLFFNKISPVYVLIFILKNDSNMVAFVVLPNRLGASIKTCSFSNSINFLINKVLSMYKEEFSL